MTAKHPAHGPALPPNIRGALFMVVSMALFTANDTLVKFVTDDINVGQAMLIRGVFATALLGAIAFATGALRAPRQALHPIVLGRAGTDSLSTCAYLLALQHIPLGDTVAIYQALPLVVTLGAMLLFGEYVGWRRWLAIGLGFLGVLVVVRPGAAGFNPYALLLLASVLTSAVRDLLMRSVPREIPSTLISFVISCSVTVFGALLVQPMGGWVTPSVGDVGCLALSALLLATGYQFFIISTRFGDVSVIAPFRYTSLLWGVLLGAVVFGEVPDAAMLTGSAMILASGLYTLHRERIVQKARNASESAAKSPPPGGAA